MADTPPEMFYVDDSPDDRFFAEYTASRSTVPFQLKTFATGIAAILDIERRIARGEKLPDLLVADHYMPIMDGPELLKRIRENEALHSVRLAVCSGGDDPFDIEAALTAGAAVVLPKPIDFDVCRKLLDDHAPTA